MNKECEVKLTTLGEELLNKAINGESLKVSEWKELVEECRDYSITEELIDDSGRWTDYVNVIFKYKGKYYGIAFDRAKTECQENEYYSCSLNEYHKVIKTIESWEIVHND